MNENRSQIAVDRSQLVEEAYGLAGFTVIRDLRSGNYSLEEAFGLAGFTVIRDLRSVNISLCEYSQ